MLNTFHTNKKLLMALNNQEAEYVVVGSLALLYHCPQQDRIADDLDLLINPAPENAKRVKAAFDYLDKIGMNETQTNIDYMELTKPNLHLVLKRHLWADILTPTEDFEFDKVYSKAIQEKINGISARITSCFDLIKLYEIALANVMAEYQKLQADTELLKNKCK